MRFRVAVEYHGALESILLDNVQIEASGGAACACVSVVETFADRFSVDSFSNDDGDQSWSGAWIEVDGDGAGPNDGNVEVHNGELILDDRPDTGGTPGVQREADLSAYASATLEFAWATTDDVDSSDAARVEISANGGASWTTLETFTGITGENNATRSFDITPYIAANTRIRFRITANYGGSGEEFHVDDVVIRGTLPCPTVDHFAIAHDGDAVTCAPEPVTLTAHAADHAVETGYEGAVSLSTSTGTGDWALASGNGTLVNAGGGNATYTFVAADSGTVGLTLRHTATGTVDIDVTDGTVSEGAAEDPALAFAEAGFRFLADGVANAIPTQVAGRTAPQTVELEAIRTDTATGACQAALTGAVAVELAFVCDDPGGCVAGRDVAVNGTDIAANPAGAPSSYTAVALDFGDATDTTAAFSLRYPEAGRIRLHARYALPDAGGTPTANLMLGASNAFVVRPFGFDVDLAGDRAANGTAGASFAADAAGSRFRMAGESFSTTVRAVAWSAADDADADGVPDTGADLTDNIATENFGQESAPATASITHALAAPLGGSAGTLSGTTTLGGFSAGAATTSLTWDEVGIVHLLANHADYLGGGAAVTGAARNVGRFYPARLTVTDSGPSLRDGPDGTWTCGFTYMDQPFAFDADPVFTLTARGLAGNVTANYGGAFFKLAGPYLANRGYASSATSSGTLDAPALGTVTLAGESDLDGIATLTLAGETFAYLRGASPEAAFAGSVDLTIPAGDLTDSDGVCHHASVASCNTGAGDTGQGYAVTAITGTELRFGRLLVANAIGSELLPLVVPARAEVWNGAGFVVHTDDGCSVVATAHLDLVNADADPALGVATIAIGAGTTTASFATSTLAAGDAGLAFTAPLAGNTGYTDLRLDLSTASGADLPWLRFDWDGDGAHDDDPTARATFGVYPGSSRVIIVREPW
ncbi:MAG: hypothetical protein H6982_10340 [Chromatiales bacterium]|nr:hypothetical protein [Chromatiales bacterium]